MRLIDEEYTKHPFYGVDRMTAVLSRLGHAVNPKRIRRLMRLMGLEAIYPKPNLSKSLQEHKVYPYLLRNVTINRADQVWSADITYIRLAHGFIYLVAVMDWFSRYVLSHEFSTTLDKDFCVKALQDALEVATPDIFNTDQGSQFTSFVERLWRSVKYECVYLHNFETVQDAILWIGRYFEFYNNDRPHKALDYRTPTEVYFENFFRRNPP